MTKPLPTPKEAARAAKTLQQDCYPGLSFDLAIALLKAYAAGELVERERTPDELRAMGVCTCGQQFKDPKCTAVRHD